MNVFALRTDNEKTGYGLANFAIEAYNENWIYAKGYYGQVITEDNLQMYSELYPGYYTTEKVEYLESHIGEKASDCIGLVKSYMWTNGNVLNPDYEVFPDYNADMLFQASTDKGRIDSIQEEQGIVLYCSNPSHIGIYIGNGKVIHNTNGTNITYENLNDFMWEYWMKPEQIQYNEYEENEEQAHTLFGRQVDSITAALGFLPSDIVVVLGINILFMIMLGLMRIIL